MSRSARTKRIPTHPGEVLLEEFLEVRPDVLDVTGSCGVVGLAGLAAGQEGLLEGSAGLLAW